jgi:iron complex transport system permease protein
LHYFILVFLLIILFFLHLLAGEQVFSFWEVHYYFYQFFFNDFSIPQHTKSFIFWEIRLPRTFTALCVGASIGVSGLLTQTFFRNALAEPNLLGINSGASLGVAILTFGVGESFTQVLLWQGNGVWALLLMSALGAFGIMLLMLLVAWRVQEPTILLIFGFMVGSFVGALVGLWQYYSHPEQLQTFIRWGMGSLGGVSNIQLQILFSVSFLAIFLSFFMIKWLNIWLLGDLYAQSLGVSLWKMRIICVCLISILASNVTAFCGLIGFLGIIVPHVARWYARSNQHQKLLPLCVIFGAMFMFLCDMIAKSSLFGGVLPLNTVTALLGVPIIVIILIIRK